MRFKFSCKVFWLYGIVSHLKIKELEDKIQILKEY
jgi:hypothetical protein